MVLVMVSNSIGDIYLPILILGSGVYCWCNLNHPLHWEAGRSPLGCTNAKLSFLFLCEPCILYSFSNLTCSRHLFTSTAVLNLIFLLMYFELSCYVPFVLPKFPIFVHNVYSILDINKISLNLKFSMFFYFKTSGGFPRPVHGII